MTVIVIVKGFHFPLTSMGRSSEEKINKETAVLNDTLDQINLIDILRAFHDKSSRIYILFKCTWNIFCDIPNARTQNNSQ